MPSLDDRKAVGRVGQISRGATKLDRKTGAGDQRIKSCQRIERAGESVAMWTELIGEIRQDAIDLLDFFDLQLTDAIPRFDRRRRLDEKSASGGRRVVDDATDGTLRFASNRDHVTSIANRHRHVRDTLVGLELRHRPLEQPNQLTLRSFELAADFSQR